MTDAEKACSMIPLFPHFKKLEISDRDEIKKHTELCKPYSDFNFTNMWIWDTAQKRQISLLNGNLVMHTTDYLTAEPILTFFGEVLPDQTANEVIDFAVQTDITPVLRFISEETAHAITDKSLSVTPDEENFDYIFSVSDLVDLPGSKFQNRRKAVNRFIRTYPNASFSVTSLRDGDIQEQLMALCEHWMAHKRSDTKYNSELERIALLRVMQSAGEHDLFVSCVHIDNKLAAFGIDEILANEYAISHFVKADISYVGAYDYLNTCAAKYLSGKGVHFWNWEQDLNIEGLRQLKRSYRPVDYLKKYIIQKI